MDSLSVLIFIKTITRAKPGQVAGQVYNTAQANHVPESANVWQHDREDPLLDCQFLSGCRCFQIIFYLPSCTMSSQYNAGIKKDPGKRRYVSYKQIYIKTVLLQSYMCSPHIFLVQFIGENGTTSTYFVSLFYIFKNTNSLWMLKTIQACNLFEFAQAISLLFYSPYFTIHKYSIYLYKAQKEYVFMFVRKYSQKIRTRLSLKIFLLSLSLLKKK